MKKFQFPLETLLRHRANLEEQERAKLSKIQSRLEGERRRLADLARAAAVTAAELGRLRLEAADNGEFTRFYLFLDRLEREMEQCRRRIAELEKEVAAQREAVVEASKDKKLLDTLKRRRLREHTELEEKEEQKTVDEIVVTRLAFREP